MSYIETRLIIDGKSYDGRQIELIELGRNVERERIIKLLENDKWHSVYLGTARMGKPASRYHTQDCIGCELIAAIKGEDDE